MTSIQKSKLDNGFKKRKRRVKNLHRQFYSTQKVVTKMFIQRLVEIANFCFNISKIKAVTTIGLPVFN